MFILKRVRDSDVPIKFVVGIRSPEGETKNAPQKFGVGSCKFAFFGFESIVFRKFIMILMYTPYGNTIGRRYIRYIIVLYHCTIIYIYIYIT